MKAVILAGGRGSRLAEETGLQPKPMVEIGGKPILWHIMSLYARAGIRDFIVCAGYKGHMIKEYFANLMLHQSDVRIDLGSGRIDYLDRTAPLDWRVLVADTGEATMTGGRLKRIRGHLGDGPFCMTYGDGLADVDIAGTVAFHRSHGRLATLTAVRPPARFGAVELDGERVTAFHEKHQAREGRINGGFFVLSPEVLDRIEGDATVFEQAPLEGLAADGELRAWRHDGFWQPMDTLRDRDTLEALWASGTAPWL